MRQLVVWVLFGALFATLVVPAQARPIDDDGDTPAHCWHRCPTEAVELTALPTQAPATSTPVPVATSVPATSVPPTATLKPSLTATARPTEQSSEPTEAATSTPQYAATKTFAQTPVPGQTPQPLASPTGTPVRPIIKSIMPLRVKPGDWVTITGDHFLSDWTRDVTTLMVTYTRVGTNAGGLLAQVYPPYGDVMWEQSAIQFKMPNIPPQEIYISVLAGGFFDTASRALTVEAAPTPTVTTSPTPTATATPDVHWESATPALSTGPAASTVFWR